MAVDPLSLCVRFLVGIVVSLVSVYIARKKSLLDPTGSLAAYELLAIHFVAGYRYGALLLVFLVCSWIPTAAFLDGKTTRGFRKTAQSWDWLKFLFKCGTATVMVLFLALLSVGDDWCLDSSDSALANSLVGGIVGFYSGDLANAFSFIFMTGKKASKGFHGRIKFTVLVASSMVGIIPGFTFVGVGLLTSECNPQLGIVLISGFAGFVGSLLGSSHTVSAISAFAVWFFY